MSSLSQAVRWLWVCSIVGQMSVLAVLFLKGNFRKLPFLTGFAALNLCQAGFLLVLYSLPRMDAVNTLALAWSSEVVTMLAQAFAMVEILRLILKQYEGIWGLGWRALTAVSAFVVVIVALTTRGNWAVAGWWELNRGYHLTFASALIVCLLLVRYYFIPVPASYKWILGGFCFYSCTDVLINTVLQTLLYRSFDVYQPICQFSIMLSFVLVQGIWVYALWKLLPANSRQAAPPSDFSYQRLSPEINEKLRELNDRLLRLWKLEARQN
jgi:hypothetical protein